MNFSNPITSNNFKLAGQDILNKGGSLINSGINGVSSLWDTTKGIGKNLTHSTTEQRYASYLDGNNNVVKLPELEMYNYAKQRGFDGTFTDFQNNNEYRNAILNLKADEAGGKLNSGQWGSDFNSTFDFSKTLGSVQNIANLGLSGWQLYQNIDSYGLQKDLLNKNKELLQQQIDNNRENMDYVLKERARQDTMRQNVSSQRNSTSNIRSF